MEMGFRVNIKKNPIYMQGNLSEMQNDSSQRDSELLHSSGDYDCLKLASVHQLPRGPALSLRAEHSLRTQPP